jgi:adenylate cyclase
VSDPKNVRTVRELLAALDTRGRGEEARRFDEAIWTSRGTNGAILVTDLTGFTKTTKIYGILHFLAIFRRCEQTCVPIIERHNGVMLKQEADDLIGVFPDASDAIRCGLAMLHALQALNSTLQEDERIGLCIGIEYGRYIRLEDDAYGDPVNVAYKLGEDLAETGEILIGSNAYARAKAKDFDFSAYAFDGPRRTNTAKVELEHWSLRLK